MDNILDRILRFCDYMGMNISSFASSIDVNQVTLNNYKLGKRKPSLELVEKVTKKYPQVSAEWLLRGIGSMMCGCSPDDPSLYGKTSSASVDGVSTEAQRTHNGGTTEELRKENTMLKELLAEKERTIQILLKDKQ
jgi:DNA-binding XRE family transcriptional regulator